jgi:hypothetical protein
MNFDVFLLWMRRAVSLRLQRAALRNTPPRDSCHLVSDNLTATAMKLTRRHNVQFIIYM